MPTISENKIVGDVVQIPVELWKRGPDLFVVSLTLPRGYFKDPFFIDSLAKSFNILKSEIKLPTEDELLARSAHYDEKDASVIYTPVDKFIENYSDLTLDKKLGFIFHMSRCGSTLAAQMLASNARFFVLSEPTIINALLDPALNIDLEKRSLLLRASIQCLRSCSPEACKWAFIKFRSWNILYLDLILKDFSAVMWMFIHRHGLEVLQSVLEKPPGWLRSRKGYAKYFTNFLAINENNILTISNDEYATRMLGTFCHMARNSINKNGLFVDYVHLKDHFISDLKKLWGIDLNSLEIQAMNNISELYSKDVTKTKKFESDSIQKREKGTKSQIEIADRFVEKERIKLINTQYEN